MPTPTIPDGRLYMNATTYSGTTGVLPVTNGSAGTSFQPDLVWIKVRNTLGSNVLQDSVRGATAYLQSNATNAENTNTANDWFRSFNSNGFTVSSATTGGTSTVEWNTSGNTYIGWQWKAGGTAVSNTAGTITSQVSANTTSGFSVVTFTTQASGTGTVGHGLGVAPSLIITKCRGVVNGWNTYIKALGAGNYLQLNTTAAQATDVNLWNNTAPTSSVFSLGTSWAGSLTTVAYCWSEVAGYSKFGSYTGNASSDGPFCYTGFQPKFVMWKRSDSVGDWIIFDSSRNTYNYEDAQLVPNSSAAEAVTGGGFVRMDFLSNGFKIRSTDSYINASGGTYIFACFASNPFKYSNAR
jgi:hypothetical protein